MTKADTTILDSEWFERLNPILREIGETYVRLEPSPAALNEKRAEFEESSQNKDISLFPDKCMADGLQMQLDALAGLRGAIDSRESQPLVRQAYIDFIDSLAANGRMIIAACNHDADAFRRENETLYGAPNKEIFQAACAWIRADASAMMHSGDDAIKRLAEDVLRVIPEGSTGYGILIPSETVFQNVRKLHRQDAGFYDLLFGADGFPAQPYVTQAEGDNICRRVLRNIGSDYKVVPSKNNIWSTSRGERLLMRPDGYRLDRDEFVGIVSHEIGTHILETVNGRRQPLKLLAIGLAGFERGSEGRAFLREQIVYESEAAFLDQFAWEYIVLLHIAVCLAVGYDKEPYPFSKLYKTLRCLYLLWRQERSPYSTNNEAWASQEAWYLAVRIMKGTDGKGSAYIKDIVYLEGNKRCWEVAAQDPALVLAGDSGKVDITNPAHIEILRKVGAL